MYNNNTNSIATNVYGLSLNKARAISHVVADTECNRFLVGTNALKEENEICLIEAKENEGVKLISLFNHPKEIWSITSCPFDAQKFYTVYNNNGTEYKTSLWKIVDDKTIEEVHELKGHQGYIKPIICDPLESNDYVVSLDDSTIRIWNNLDSSEPTVVKSIGNQNKLTAGCINPNINNQLATCNDVNIKGWDFRTGKESFSIDKAHTELIRTIDFNPNRAYYLLSAGEDGKLKFWDTRQTKTPVKMFSGHQHWIWNAKFNPVHDQLVITSSSDNTVKLWNVYSISHANETALAAVASPAGGEGDAPKAVAPTGGKKNKRKEDQLIKTFEEHEDSVYNICWASSNFIFASLSFDGRVVINNVPKEYSDIMSY